MTDVQHHPTALLTLDRSDAAHHAALVATALLGPNARYLALHVVEERDRSGRPRGPVHGYPYPALHLGALADPLTRSDAIDRARTLADEEASAAGVPASPLGEVGDPASAILRAARDHDVDVVVVGDHERSWFRTLVEGSVAKEVVERAGLPVLVVPLPRDDAA